jgi:succinate dehydrogenase/fumarate reductase-like Fe-S protein/nitrate reductase gamma subunit
MDAAVALWIALAIFAGGMAYRISSWFRHGFAPRAAGTGPAARVGAAARGVASTLFSARIGVVLRALLLDVILQRRLFRESRSRWLVHACVLGAFVVLLVVHALGSVITARIFPAYSPTDNPYRLLRDLLGAVLLAALVVATYRRFVRPDPRRSSRASDSWALATLAVIVLSGIALEGVKIGSYSAFDRMFEEYGEGPETRAALEAYWVEEMGTVSPAGARPTPELVAQGREVHERSCAMCHVNARWGFMGFATAKVLGPVAGPLDRIDAAGSLWTLHFVSSLLALALLPFGKLFHLVTTPLSLLVNAAVERGRSDPANVATKQMLELDACTHCCACSAHCSMVMASAVSRNENVLPSEKIAALKALAGGKPLPAPQLRSLQEGVCLCTACDRCTVSCPSGIDLLGLWLGAKEALLARGEPEFSLLSPLSLRRGLLREEIGPAAYEEALERPRRALAARFGAAGDGGSPLAPGDGRLWDSLRESLQARTFSSCFGCRTCSTACPVVRDHPSPREAFGLLPHEVMYAARLRLWDLVLGSNMLWDCLGCYQCQQHCPQGVGVTDVLYALKNAAIARAAPTVVPRGEATA